MIDNIIVPKLLNKPKERWYNKYVKSCS